MRRRFMQAAFWSVAAAVVVVAVPVLVIALRGIHDAQQAAANDRAAAVFAAVEARYDASRVSPGAAPPSTAELAALLLPGEHAVVTLPGGEVLRATAGDGPGTDPVVGTEPDLRTVPLTSPYVQLAVASGPVRRLQLGAVLAVLAVSALAVLAAMLVAGRQARRLAAPLDDLAATAERLGSGDVRPTGRRYGVPELDRVATVLDAGVERTNALLASESRIVSDVSHQLRTPLTALSLRLEEVVAVADDPEAVRTEAGAALEQAERMSAAVTELVRLRRGGRRDDLPPLQVDEAVRAAVAEVEPAYAAARRGIALRGSAGLVADASLGAQSQVLSTLLENALRHGAGTTTVTTSRTDAWVLVEVVDEGPGVPPELAERVFDRDVTGGRGTGIGLALARTLAEGDGGRLELRTVSPARFVVYLRAQPVPDATISVG